MIVSTYLNYSDNLAICWCGKEINVEREHKKKTPFLDDGMTSSRESRQEEATKQDDKQRPDIEDLKFLVEKSYLIMGSHLTIWTQAVIWWRQSAHVDLGS
jgi:hypothetical protein